MMFVRRFWLRFVLCASIWLITGCSVSPLETTPPAALPASVYETLQRSGATVYVAGYVLSDTGGTRLVPGMSVSTGTTPQPLGDVASQLWLDDAIVAPLLPQLRSVEQTRIGIALVRGQLQGPGSYGPGGRYSYTVSGARVELASVEQTTMEALLNGDVHAGTIVQLRGALLADDRSARLADKLGPGGVPEGNARQIKLQGPVDDTALLDKLQHPAGGNVRFGEVEIEAIWRDGTLIPLLLRSP